MKTVLVLKKYIPLRDNINGTKRQFPVVIVALQAKDGTVYNKILFNQAMRMHRNYRKTALENARIYQGTLVEGNPFPEDLIKRY